MVLACGANHAAPLIAPTDARLGQLLAAIPYTGSAIWTFGYRRADVAHPLDAFGFLVPKPERRAIMACTWLGTKWLGRVPDDKAVFRCFSTDPDVSREAVAADLNRLMDITAEPLFALSITAGRIPCRNIRWATPPAWRKSKRAPRRFPACT